MTSNKTTRRALFSSIMSLVLCCAMLVGTTFAWFTDTVTSTGNIIKSGTLDVEMYYGDTQAEAEAMTNDAAAGTIFDYKLWEPNFTQIKFVNIVNKSDLALKYQLKIIPADPSSDALKLGEAIMVSVNGVEVGTLKSVISTATSIVGEQKMYPDDENVVYEIKLHMDELAGNEYQNLSVGNGFVVQLLATQETFEEDSFNTTDYDKDAQYPASYSGFAAVPAGTTGNVAVSVTQTGAATVLGTVTVPASLVTPDAEGNGQVSVFVEPKADVEASVAVDADQTFVAYEITVEGITPDGATAIPVSLYIGKDLTNVEVYHDGTLIASTYDPTTGIVSFETTDFSPFDILFDKVEDNSINTIPAAKAEKLNEMPTVELLSGEPCDLDTAYKFSTLETLEQAQASTFRYWHADFVVTFDKDVAEGAIALAGQYDAFNPEWVAFAAPAMEANKPIRLLCDGPEMMGLGNKPIFVNYEELCDEVKEFNCGVATLDETAEGTTMTVELRMYETEEPSESNLNSKNFETGKFITVASFKYTF